MKTRSQTRKENKCLSILYEKSDESLPTETQCTIKTTEFQIYIDFDEASKCWMKNKKKLSNGCYKYIK